MINYIFGYNIDNLTRDRDIDGFDANSNPLKFSLSIVSSSIANTGGLRCCLSIFSLSNFSVKYIHQYFGLSHYTVLTVSDEMDCSSATLLSSLAVLPS